MNLKNKVSGFPRLLIASFVGVACMALAFKIESPDEKKVQKPNIVVILADDMGYGDVGANNPKSQVPTPNLDNLANRGMRFTDAHSGSAVCSPTRYGLVTGRYAFRTSLKKGVLGGYSPALIEADRFTVADLLKKAGYKTGVIGKWHLGLGYTKTSNAPMEVDAASGWPVGTGVQPDQPLKQGPNDLGFDYSYIIPSSLDIPPYVYYENGKPTEKGLIELEGRNSPRGVFWRKGQASPHFNIEKTLDQFSEKASEFLIASAAEKKPFFLYLPLTSPHTPWLPSDSFKGKSNAGIYGDFVAHSDGVVGRVIQTLEKLGIAENTLVIFTSDNGADWKPGDKKIYPQHQANYIYRGQKSDVWEGGHRVPFLALWPNGIKAGSVASETICLTDLMATFGSITSQKIPRNAGQDSFDFSKVLAGVQGPAPRKSTIHHSIQGMFAIRNGKWKFIDGKGSGGWSKDESADGQNAKSLVNTQLYDISQDPTESHNVVAEYPEIAKQMKAELDEQNNLGYTRPGAIR